MAAFRIVLHPGYLDLIAFDTGRLRRREDNGQGLGDGQIESRVSMVW